MTDNPMTELEPNRLAAAYLRSWSRAQMLTLEVMQNPMALELLRRAIAEYDSTGDFTETMRNARDVLHVDDQEADRA
jgi:hypothetical protein